MKGGRTPIHIQRWAPADYHEDEHVRLLYARRDWRTLTFYRTFLDRAFMAGGDLPADPEALSAVVQMPRKDVSSALDFCLGKLIYAEGDRLYQKRVRRDIADELEFREQQAERGKLSGEARKRTTVQPSFNDRSTGRLNPPSPAPVPAPAPAPIGTANPLIQGKRPSMELEAYRLIREINALEPELDGTEILLEATSWQGRDGRTRSKVRIETLSDDHLIRTIHDLRKNLEEARAHGKADEEKRRTGS